MYIFRQLTPRLVLFLIVLFCGNRAVYATSEDNINDILEEAVRAIHFDREYEKGIKMLQEVIRDRHDAKAYFELGQAYRLIGKTKEAARAYTEAAHRCDTIAPTAYIYALRLLEEAGMESEATKVYEQAFKWHKECPKWWDDMQTVYAMRLNSFIKKEENAKALRLAQDALAVMDKKGVSKWAGIRCGTLSTIVQCAKKLGNDSVVFAYGPMIVDALEAISPEARSKTHYGIGLLNGAIDYYNMTRDYARAEDAYQLLLQTDDTDSHRANYLMGYANLISDLGRSEEAIKLWQEAAELFRKAKKPLLVGYIQCQIVFTLLANKDYSSAVDAFNLLPELVEEIKNEPNLDKTGATNLLSKCADLTMFFGEYEEALQMYDTLILLHKATKNNIGFANTLLLKGICHHYLGNYENALSLYESAYKVLDMENHPSTKLSLLSNEGEALTALGRADEAVKKYVEVIKLLRQMISHDFVYMTDRERHEFWLGNYNYFDNIHGLPSAGNLRYEAALVNNGILLDTSSRIRDRIRTSNDEELKADFTRLNNMYASGKQSAEFSALERKIQHRMQEIGLFNTAANTTLKDVQKQLKANDRAIEIVKHYSVSDNFAYDALILGPQGDVIIEPLPSQQEVESLDAFEIYKDENLLSIKFWEPILRHCPNGGNIFISADGIYHKIAFEHLPISGTPISRTRNVVRVSSTRQLASGQPLQTNSVLLCGGIDYYKSADENMPNIDVASPTLRSGTMLSRWKYLPGTLHEINSIENLLKEGKRPIDCLTMKSDECTETGFMDNATKGHDIIHIATHGFYLPADENLMQQSMSRTGLALSGANRYWAKGLIQDGQRDGILTASEIAKLDLTGTQLLVLSACKSGLGDINSEGVYGLPRAFKQSGVGSIVMTLWPVNDEVTGEIMTAFYDGLLHGKKPREAMSYATQLKGQSDPSLWAAFVIID